MALILVIDDDPEIREMVATKLAGADHEVLVARNGDEGLALATERSPDVVLADWMIPGPSGIDICQAVRATSDAIVFLMTARSQPADVQRGYEAGADGYIVKPFSPRELLASIDSALAVRRDDAARRADAAGPSEG